MNENTKMVLTLFIAVVLSVSISYTLITPREGSMGLTGPQGEAAQGIQGEQGPQGIQGLPGESFSLSGTWKCTHDVENHPVADILEVEIDADVFIIQWYYSTEGVWDDRLEELYFSIKVNTAYNIQFEEAARGKSGGGTILLMGAGKYRIYTRANYLDRIWINIKVFQLG